MTCRKMTKIKYSTDYRATNTYYTARCISAWPATAAWIVKVIYKKYILKYVI